MPHRRRVGCRLRRIGHSHPIVTLGMHAHLFGDTDEKAAAVVEAAPSSALREANQP